MCDQTHSLGLCETDFVHSVELSPALGEVDTFFVLLFIISKVDEGEILEVRGGRGEERGGVNKCLWESGHR